MSDITEGGLSSVDATETPKSSSEAGVNLGGKGAKQVVANESVLANMEKLYQQKQAQTGGFLGSIVEGLKDASAWTSGGMHGPAEALALRQATKEKQAKDLFEMQTQIAAQKNAIQNRNSFFGGAAGQPATGAPQAGGASGQVDNAPGQAQVNQASGGLLGLVNDPALRTQIGATYLEDPTKAMSQLNAYLAKRAEEPQVKKEIDYLVRSGMDPKQALPAAMVKVFGPGAYNLQDVRGPGGTGQANPLGMAGVNAPGATGAPAAAPVPTPSPAAPRAIATPPTTIAPKVTTPTAAAPAAPLNQFGLSAEDEKYVVRDKNNNVIDILAREPTTAPAPSISGQPIGVRAPEAPTTSPFTPGTKEDLEYKAKIAEKRAVSEIESDTKAKTEEETDAQKRLSKYAVTASTAPETISKLNTFQNLIKANGDSIGFGAQAGPRGALLDAIEKSKKLPADKETAIKLLLGNEAYEARQNILSLSQDLALEYRNQVLKGTGAISDMETKAAEKAKGLGDENSPRVNIAYAQLMQAHQEQARNITAGWSAYQKAEAQAGRTAKFNQFEKSDMKKSLDAQYDKKLSDMEKSWPGTNKTASSNPSMGFEDPNKEKQYQEWVKSRQGGK